LTIRKPTVTDIGLLLILSLIWASAFLAIKVVVPETGPFWLAAIRVAIGFAVLLPWALATRGALPGTFGEWRLIGLIVLLNVTAPFLLISWAELTIDAGVASLLMGSGPLMAVIISHFATRDDCISVTKLLAVALGFSGILVVVGGDAIGRLGDNLAGQAAALLGASCYVTSGVLVRKIDRIQPLHLSVIVLFLASIILTSLALAVDGLPGRDISGAAWVWLIYLGVFPTGLAYFLRYNLIQKIGLSTFSIGVNLIPVFGVGLGFLVLGEPVSVQTVLALLLVVSGLFVARNGPAIYLMFKNRTG
jgi:drug/metabolite transporter (DMT)-like permease